MTTLTCLYLGVWKFPDTVDVKRATYFPNLRELGLYTILMESKDLDFLLDNSPMIETLCVKSNLFKLNLRLVRQSIRCVKIIMSFFGEIYVVDTLFLERLIISRGWTNDGVCNKVNIGHATKFHSLGYLDSGNHVLEFSNTVIKVRAKVIPSTMIPSVGILALNVCCGVHNYGKMILTILKCFLNVEMLHIIVKPLVLMLEFICTILLEKLVNPLASTTMSSGTIKCISSCIKQLVFHDFQGGRNELDFLKFFFKSVFVLKEVEIVMQMEVSLRWRICFPK
ncbi:F-box/FBD/LRR-repeat protein [Hordeum vulgare]|nr:F-box/FBD/LRR-repeat protein [Hordeum vulgare]